MGKATSIDERWIVEYLAVGSDKWQNALMIYGEGFSNRDAFNDIEPAIAWMISIREFAPNTSHLRLRDTISNEIIPCEAL